MNRQEMIGALIARSEAWGICIIGGGGTGAGGAVDAASRGFSVLLLEQYDFAKGTSSRATKLVHGGVRYLQQGNIKLVTEALRAGVLYHDGQFDDARLAINLAQTAACHGAVLLNYFRVDGLLKKEGG